jgi:hypothetical protein
MRCVLCSKVGLFLLSVLPVITSTTPFIYPLYVDHPSLNLVSEYRSTQDLDDQILQKYSDVENRWRTSRPVNSFDSSPPVAIEDAGSRRFSYLPLTRGARQERSDFASNLQAGAPPFQGPSGPAIQNGNRASSSANPLFGGNFCDEGSVSSRCVISQPLLFPGNYTISGRETVPFAITKYCACNGAGCRCSVDFENFLPGWASITWARLSAEAERGGAFKSWKTAKVDGNLVQGSCTVPVVCDGLESQEGRSSRCGLVCGQYVPCVTRIDVTDIAGDGKINFEALDGGSEYPSDSCGGHTLNARVTLEGEYTVNGVLDVKSGGGLFCELPNCSLSIQDYRWINIHEGGTIAADTVSIRTASLTVAGSVHALSMQVVVGSIVMNRTGQLSTSDREVRGRRSASDS